MEPSLQAALEDARREMDALVEVRFDALRCKLEGEFERALAGGVAAAIERFRHSGLGAVGTRYWMALSPEEQQRHLRAQRFARVKTAEIRLHKSREVKAGRASANIYELLAEEIDAARAAFEQRFVMPAAGMVDYLHIEIVKTLANDDPTLLGSGYPGPLA